MQFMRRIPKKTRQECSDCRELMLSRIADRKMPVQYQRLPRKQRSGVETYRCLLCYSFLTIEVGDSNMRGPAKESAAA
jgi:hypothetical protein